MPTNYIRSSLSLTFPSPLGLSRRVIFTKIRKSNALVHATLNSPLPTKSKLLSKTESSLTFSIKTFQTTNSLQRYFTLNNLVLILYNSMFQSLTMMFYICIFFLQWVSNLTLGTCICSILHSTKYSNGHLEKIEDKNMLKLI